MSIIVYWALPDHNFVNEPPNEYFIPYCKSFEDKDFSAAMKHMEVIRREGRASHVSFSSEPSGLVGKPGVDTVADGKTPDGHQYEWSKAHRAGASKRRS